MPIALVAAAVLLSGLVAPLAVRPLLLRLNVIDVPNHRSSHFRPVVRGGGLAPLVAMVVGYALVLAGGRAESQHVLIFGVTAVAAAALGFAEDIRGLPVRVRAGGQLLIGLIAAVAIVSSSGATWWLVPILGVAVAGYINVANFMDGVDGISGMHGAVVGVVFALVGTFSGNAWLAVAGIILAIAFATFLPWNIFRGGMFLGDAGSYLLGAAVSSIAAAAFASGVPLLAVLGPTSVYLADTGFTLAGRVVRGERWFESHRSHFYHRLCDLGLSHLQVAAVVSVATAIAGAFGLLSLGSAPWGSAAGVVGILVVVTAYLALPNFLRLRWRTPEVDDEPAHVPESTLPDRLGVNTNGAWAVIGPSGFIGSALVRELQGRGIAVRQISAPRMMLDHESDPAAVLRNLGLHVDEVGALRRQLSGVSVVVNAAGLAAPDSPASDALFGANALLPVLIAQAVEGTAVRRYVHLSSAAVQGRRQVLDETASMRPFSPYSKAKALGEASLLEYLRQFDTSETPELVIVRATSVQGPGRPTTAHLRRVATSPIASVARPGDRPTVVSSLRGLIEFVTTVGARTESVPTIVLQPWEGLTTAAVLKHAGGRDPIMLPFNLCRVVLAGGYAVGAVVPSMRGIVRRVELMWMGQEQDAAWSRSVEVDRNHYVAEVLGQNEPSAQ